MRWGTIPSRTLSILPTTNLFTPRLLHNTRQLLLALQAHMTLQADEEGPVGGVYGGVEDGGEGDAVAECVSVCYEEAFGG